MKKPLLNTKKYVSILLFSCLFVITNAQTKISVTLNSPPPRADYKPVELKSSESDWVYLDVPSYIWSYGCAVTSAAMLAGYYDRNGFYCIYNGEINGGAAPINNNWPANNLPVPGSPSSYYPNYDNSIAASRINKDGRTSDGHVDDFWNAYLQSGDPDPWVNHIPPHIFDLDSRQCVGDYMGSSQDYFNNIDGSTSMTRNSDNSKLHDYYGCENQNPKTRDITHGLKMFFESCSYTVDDVYTQPIYGFNNISAGFTFDDFKAEIDAKRPVLVHFVGHTAIGIGYNSNDNKIALYDTWSQTKNKITWGSPIVTSEGKKLNMESVTVVILNGEIVKSTSASMICRVGIFTGENDYLFINPPSTHVITPGVNFSFNAIFDSYDCYTYASTFKWKMELYHSNGSYTFMNATLPGTINSCGSSSTWTSTAINSLPDYEWERNEDGNINGKVTVETIDNNGYVNYSNDYMISFNYKANKTTIETVSSDNNSITFSLKSQPSTTYKVYYGHNTNPPFTGAVGIEALEGSSPLNIGSEKVYTLTNLTDKTNIVVSAINPFGESTYSNMITFSQYTKLPYTTSFEGGIPESFWTFSSSCITKGSLQQVPHSGNGFLIIKACTSGGLTNSADLHLNLNNEKNVTLEFWMKDYGDGLDVDADGIWLSDNGGSSFKKVYDLNGSNFSNNVWYKHILDVTALALQNNLKMTKNFVIRFSQKGKFHSQGLAFDDISVSSTYTPPSNLSTITLTSSKDAVLMMRAKPGLEYMANTNYGTFPMIKADIWSVSGYHSVTKSLIDFDLSSFPKDNTVVKSAYLSLYANDPQPNNEYKQISNLSIGSSTYKSNACWLKHVIEPWDENVVTYNNQPHTNDYNAKYLPISTTYTQNYLGIDISEMVENQIKHPNTYYGFLLETNTDVKYSRMAFASSNHTNTQLHPKLLVEYYINEEVYTVPFTVSGSTVSESDNWDVQGADSKDKAFIVYIPSTTTVSASTCSSNTNYNTKLEIFKADKTCSGFYNDDNVCGTNPSASTIEDAILEPGYYYFVVDGYNNLTGNFTLTVNTVTTKSTKSHEKENIESKEMRSDDYIIYPNPVKNELTVTFTESSCLVKIVDLTGRLIKQVELTQDNSIIDCSSLSEGTYILKIESSTSSRSILFEKTK